MRKLIGFAAVLIVLGAGWRIFAVSDQKPSDPSKPSAVATIANPAPGFTLENQNGHKISLADFKGKFVILEWTNPDCPFVQRHYREKTMTTLEAQYKDRDVVWLAINSTDTDDNAFNKKWVNDQHLPYPVLNDSSGQVGKAYKATNTPNMFIISKTGILLYRGAIDNDPDGDRKDGKVNYVRQALDQILAGKTVSDPETKPYGCSVKYKD